MITLPRSALLRGLTYCVQFLRLSFQRDPRPAPPIDPRLARDIGLPDADHARLIHRWPSQTMRHPRL